MNELATVEMPLSKALQGEDCECCENKLNVLRSKEVTSSFCLHLLSDKVEILE